MKKLTLMLCACAMALAMVLVSCKNEPEEYVDVTSHSYDYIYSVTGTLKQVDEVGPKDSTTKTITEWTYTAANGNAWWSKDSRENEPESYGVSFDGYADKSVKVGDGDPTKTYKNSVSSGHFDWFGRVYKFSGKFYIKDRNNEYVEVTVSPDFKKAGFTYSGSFTIKNSGHTDDNVNTTTYSIDLTFAKPIN